jgi:hypothetical protein
MGEILIIFAPEPPLPPPGIPEYVPLFKGTIDTNNLAYMVICDQDSQVRVEFENKNSINGLWKGKNATFLLTTTNYRAQAATSYYSSWGPKIQKNEQRLNQSFTPWLKSTLSSDPKYCFTWINAFASLEVIYPGKISGDYYMDFRDRLEHKVRLFFISNKDLKMKTTYDLWKNYHTDIAKDEEYLRTSRNSLVVFLIIPVGFMILGVFLIVKNIKKIRM